MARGQRGDGQRSEPNLAGPVELFAVVARKAEFRKYGAHAEAGDPACAAEALHARELLHCARSEMVIVIVGDEHGIDGGQVFQPKRGREKALWAGPFCWRGAFIPHRIDQNPDSVDLEQGGRVAEPGDAQARGRACLVDPRVGMEGTQGMVWGSRRGIEKEARQYLERQWET